MARKNENTEAVEGAEQAPERRSIGVKVDMALYAFLDEARWEHRASSLGGMVLVALEEWAAQRGFVRATEDV